MKHHLADRARRILGKLDPRKPKHGPIPQYITRRMLVKQAMDEWAWLTAPESAHHFYDSSLSDPGRICWVCRAWLAGKGRDCPLCGGKAAKRLIPSIVFLLVPLGLIGG